MRRRLSWLLNWGQDNLPLIFIVFLAFALRYEKLNANGFWLDELITFHYAQISPLIRQILIAVGETTHPPLYYLLIKSWMAITEIFSRDGASPETSLRLFSTLADCGSVILIARLCRACQLSRRTSLFAALLYALAPRAIYFAQEARPYSLMIFLALLYVLLLVEGFQKRTATWQIVAATVAAFALSQTHYFGLLAVSYLGLSACALTPRTALDRPIFKDVLIGMSIFAFCLACVMIYRDQMANHIRLGQSWIKPVDSDTLRSFSEWLLGANTAGSNVVSPTIWIFCINVLAAALIRPRAKLRSALRIVFGLSLWVSGSMVFAVIYEARFSPIWVFRYFILTLPALVLAWAFAWDRLDHGFRPLALFVAAVGLSSVAFVTQTARTEIRPLKSYLRDGLEVILSFENQKSHRALQVKVCAINPEFMAEYLNVKLGRTVPQGLRCQLDDLAKITGETWLVSYQDPPDLEAKLHSTGLKYEVQFRMGDTTVFRINPENI